MNESIKMTVFILIIKVISNIEYLMTLLLSAQIEHIMNTHVSSKLLTTFISFNIKDTDLIK